MTQALFTSMTGLNAGTEQLTVVSDNIANMNTTAYKTSRVDFQDIWYRTNTTGTNSTMNSGGTNPYQIGVGVQCASITKNFDASITNTTGKATDMAITGKGWFTVLSPDEQILLTRDGTFSLDEKGYLCTANGCKVLGMDQILSTTGCTVPIKLPSQIQVVEEATKASKLEKMKLSDLNCVQQITGGDFKVVANYKQGDQMQTKDITVTLDINSATTVKDIADAINTAGGDYFSCSVVDGAIQIKLGNATSLDFEGVAGGSNFLNQTNIASVSLAADNTYTSSPLNMSAEISEAFDVTADTTKLYKSFSVGQDGMVTVTYSDGSTLSVVANDDGSTYFSYTDKNGVVINDDVNNSHNDTVSLYVDPNLLVKANMQMQIAVVTNDNGLVGAGNNQYEIGVNTGDVLYTATNVNGAGALVTGALETSNVDLAEQFANMILAQRLVQANSQVFNGANSMLETLVYLGR